MQWHLEAGTQAGTAKDPGFPFALGAFFKQVGDNFSHKVELSANNVPADFAPYGVRFQFRPAANQWPLFQLGPGVATVNFTSPYTWRAFYDHALVLRQNVVEAYRGIYQLKPKSLQLQYRNVIPFNYRTANVLDFLGNSLNTVIQIPGQFTAGETPPTPRTLDLRVTFALPQLAGAGTFRVVTGTQKESDEPDVPATDALILDLSVASENEETPDFHHEAAFAAWLTAAHDVIHAWFFALVAGDLLNHYR